MEILISLNGKTAWIKDSTGELKGMIIIDRYEQEPDATVFLYKDEKIIATFKKCYLLVEQRTIIDTTKNTLTPHLRSHREAIARKDIENKGGK